MKQGTGRPAWLALCLCATSAFAQSHIAPLSRPPGAYDAAARGATAVQFSAGHSDSYDFLIVFPTFAARPAPDVVGLHTFIRNDVQGIGVPVSAAAGFGPATRLKGYIDVFALEPAGAGTSVESAAGIAAHEVLHQWGAKLAYADPQTGLPRFDLLGARDLAGVSPWHWSFFLSSEASVLYGSEWKPTAPGVYTSVAARKRYSQLDLYLMGLLRPDEVSPVTLLRPAGPTSFQQTDLPPPDGTTLNATAEQVTIAQIVAANGPRVPAAHLAQKTFRAGFALLLPVGASPTPSQRAYVDAVRKSFSDSFFFLTGGRAVVETELVEVPAGPVAANPSVAAGLDYLLSRQGLDGLWADTAATRLRDSQAGAEALALFANDARTAPALVRVAAGLSQSVTDGVDAVSRRALGLFAAHAPMGSVRAALEGHVRRDALNADFGFGYARGYGSTPHDTVLAAEALLASGATPAELDPQVTYLLGARNSDGGWPFVPGGPSRLEPTARIVVLLSKLTRTPAVTAAATAAQAFIATRAQAGGLYRDEGSSILATVAAIRALDAWDQLTTPAATALAASLLALQQPDGSWGGTAHETAAVLTVLRLLLTPNLTLTPADVTLAQPAATEGEDVAVQVTVRNVGHAPAGPFLVRGFDSSSAPFGPGTPVAGLAEGGAVTVTLVLSTAGHGGSTQLFVVADALGAVDELAEDDNRAAVPFSVTPAPTQADLVLLASSVAFSPAMLSALPTNLSVSVRVANLGLQASGPTVLRVTAAGASVDVPVSVAAQSNTVVTAVLAVAAAVPPQLAVAFAVDPNDAVVEANEANNQLGALVPVTPRVDLAVSGLQLSASAATQGQPVTASWLASNRGTAPALDGTVVVTVRAGATVVSTQSFPAQLLGGQQVVGTATVPTGVTGALVVEVRALASADADSGNDAQTAALTVTASALANLRVDASAVQLSPAAPLQGEPVNVTSVVRNTGNSATPPSVFELYLGSPAAGGVRVDRQTIAAIPAGASATVVSTLTPADAAATVLATKVDADGQVTEFDEADNLTVVPFDPKSRADLVLTASDIRPSVAAPTPNTTVSVTVSVLNAGEQPAGGVTVELFLGAPEAGGVLVGTQSIAVLDGESRADAVFAWSTQNLSGPQLLVARVALVDPSKEQRTDNNRAEKTVTVQSGDLALSSAYLSPNGDGVKDDTQVSYTLQTAEPVTLRIVDARAKVTRTLTAASATSGALTWDGKDDSGARAADGPYQLRLFRGPAASETFVGALLATVDVNRSPIEDAFGTPLLTFTAFPGTHFPSSSSAYGGLYAPLPDDSGLVVFASPPATPVDPTPCGFYLLPASGDAPVRLSPASGFNCTEVTSSSYRQLRVSPDGSEVFFVGRTAGLHQVRAFSRATQLVRTVVAHAPTAPISSFIEFSPDGQHVAFLSSQGVELAGADGSNRHVLAANSLSLQQPRFSPDGAFVAFVVDDEAIHVVPVAGGPAKVVVANVALALGNSNDGPVLGWLPGDELLFVEEGGEDTNGNALPNRVQAVNVLTLARRTVLTDFAFDPVLSPTGTASTFNRACSGEGGCTRVLVSAPLGTPLRDGFVPSGFNELRGLSWWPQGSVLSLNEPSFGALSTRANLTNRFVPIRSGNTFSFRGIEADLNFDEHELAVRKLGATGPFTVVSRSPLEAVNATFAQWSPSAPGVYDVRVTAVDLAGNRLERTTKVAWATAPAVSGFARTPEFISPNGDGVQDVATFSYTVAAPVTVNVAVRNAAGTQQQVLFATHLDAGAFSQTWDGTGVSGVVPDGVYTLSSEGAEFPVTVDSTPPTAEFAFDLDAGSAETSFGLVLHPANPQSSPKPSFGVELHVVHTLRASDTHLVGWSLERSAVGSPTGFAEFEASGTTTLNERSFTVLSQQARGRYVRVRARDRAGNEYLTPSKQPKEALFVTEAGAALIAAGNPEWLTDADIDAAGVSTFIGAYVDAPMVFALEHTIAEPIASVAIEILAPASAPTLPPAVGTRYVQWDATNLGLNPVLDLRLKFHATTATGRIFTAEALLKPPTEVPGVECTEVPTASLGPRLRMPLGRDTVSLASVSGGDLRTFSAQASALVDIGELSECLYTVTFLDSSKAEVPIVGTRNFCGVFSSAEILGDDLTVALSESFPGPINVAVRHRGNGRFLGSTGIFEGSTTLTVPTQPQDSCQPLELRLTATLADGGLVEISPNPSYCEEAGNPPAPCASLALGAPVRDGRGTLCSAHVPTWAVPVTRVGPVGNLAAEVFPLLGLPKSQIPIGGSSATVATAALAEGTYLVGVTGKDPFDAGISATLASSNAIVVDRTPPTAFLTQPLGGTVCATAFTDPTGVTTKRLEVRGSVADAHLEGYGVYLRAGIAASYTAIGSGAAAAPSASGLLATVNASSLPAGDFELLLEAVDVSGSAACGPPVAFHFEPPVEVPALTATPALFTSATTAQFSLSRAASASLTVESGASSLGLVAQGSFPAGANPVTWNGSVNGVPLPDGDYRLRLAATDLCLDVAEKTTPVTLDRTPPVARLDAPLPGASAGAALEVTGEASDLHLASWELAWGTGGAFTVFATGAASATGVLAALSTQPLTPGSYDLRLRATDRVGLETTVFSSFVVPTPDLISGLSAVPALISPNGDGVLDTSSLTVTLNRAATVTVELVSAGGAVLATLSAPAARPAGASVFVLTPTAADGSHRVRVTATDGATPDVQTTPLILDTTAPVIAVAAPAAQSTVRGTTPVAVSVVDAHPGTWVVSRRTAGVTTAVASGQGAVGQLPDLTGLSSGAHELLVDATDEAGNHRQTVVGFSSDTTAPLVAFLSPLGGAHLSGGAGPVAVSGQVSEPNLASLKLEAAATPTGPRHVLASFAALPPSAQLALWDVLAEPDGPVVLFLTAVDTAGNRGEAQLALTIDNTPPVALVTAPGANARVSALGAVVGTASDANLLSYDLAVGAGAAGAFVPMGGGSASVTAGTLAALAGSLTDGPYRVRLSVIDRAGNRTEAVVAFTLDAQPPGAPQPLTATALPGGDVVLAWTAPVDPDVAAYRVFRARGQDPFTLLTEVTSTGHLDTGPADGDYRYQVVAVDTAGNVGAPAGPALVTIDATPPAAIISKPLGGKVSGLVEVTGSAFSLNDFKEYRLKVGATLLATATAPVLNGRLGELDASALPQGSTQTLTLEAEDTHGNVASAVVTLQVDNLAPAAPVLVSAVATGTTAVVTWQPSGEPDLKGYLLFRSGALANAPAGSSFSDITPYLLPPGATTFTDSGLTDGTWTYELQAVDEALNFSPLSNARSVTIETRAPAALITSPASLARVSGQVALLAESADSDLASVQFEIRPLGAPAFTALGPPRTLFPWAGVFDTALFSGAVFELRAVATDVNGNTDAAPASVFVFVDPGPVAPAVTTLVNATNVSVGWTGSGAAFTVQRDGVELLATTNFLGTSTASSSAVGTPAAAFDRNFSSLWRAAPGFPQTFEVTLPRAQLLTAVRLFTLSPSTGVELLLGADWVPAGNAVLVGSVATLTLPRALAVSGVRFRFTAGPVPAELTEVFLDGRTSLLAAPHTAGQTIGTQSYAVSAFSIYGGVALGSAPARVYRPAVVAPAAVVSTPALVLEGDDVTAGASVNITANGVAAGQGLADGSGRFAVSLTLAPGVSTLVATATDAAGNVSLPSTPRSVEYEPPPVSPVVLALDGVTGSTVSLSFAVGAPGTDFAGFDVARTTGATTVALPPLGAAARSFTDVAPNGVHSYVVTPFSAHHFPGTASNSVSATVSAASLGPVLGLTVAAPPGGGALALSWSPLPGAASYQVSRGASAGGPFAPVATGATVDLTDVGLTNGVTYFYVVRGVDAAGNPGSPSAVASGTPQDATAPVAPRLTAPTVPGSPITVTAPTASVRGVVEANAQVELFRNGVSLGTTQASPDAVQIASIPTPSAPFELVLSPDGTMVGHRASTGLVIVSLATGQAVTLPTPANAFLSGPPVFSPDGTRVAVEAFVTTDSRIHLYLGSTSGGVLTRLPLLAARHEEHPAFSPDSQHLAFRVRASGLPRIHVLALLTGVERNTSIGVGLQTPVWRPTGTALYAVGVSGSTTLMVDISFATLGLTNAFTVGKTLFGAPVARPPLGDTVAFNASNAGSQTDVYEMTGAVVTQLTNNPQSEQTPTYSADGSALLYFSGGDAQRFDRATQAESPLGFAGTGRIFALGGGYAFFDGQQLQTAERTGGFVFPNVPLAAGLNGFYAVARDAAGNLSAPSAGIEVTYDAASSADLSVTAVVDPSAATPGQQVRALLTIHNAGPAAAAGTQVVARVLGNDGSVRVAPTVTLAATLAPNATATALVDLDVLGLSGLQSMSAEVDPTHQVADPDRSNNLAAVPFSIVTTTTPVASVSLGTASLTANQTTPATALVSNPAASATLSVQLSLRTSSGQLVQLLGGPEVLTAAASATVVRSVSSGTLLAGSYVVVAEVFDGGAKVASAQTPLAIVPATGVAVTVSPAQASGPTSAPVLLDSDVTNGSVNTFLLGATHRLEVRDVSNAVVFSRTASIPSLAPGASTRLTAVIAAGALPPGTYAVTAEVLGLASASSTFSVVGVAQPVGTLTFPPSVGVGASVAVVSQVQNAGSAPTGPLQLQLVASDPFLGTSMTVATHAVSALAPGASAFFTDALSTASLAPGSYVLSLTADDGAGPVVLASGTLAVTDATAPVVTVLSPNAGALVAGAAFVSLRAQDDFSGVAGVELFVDGVSAGAMAQASGSALDGVWERIAPLADGPRVLAFRVVDAAGNVTLVSRSVVSDTTPPVITVTGVVDGALVDAVAPVFSATDAHLVSVEGQLDGVVFASGSAVVTDGAHVLLVRAVDGAGNLATRSVSFERDSRAPTLVVTGVFDGQVTNLTVVPFASASDPHLASFAVTLDGAPFTPGTPVIAEGDHLLAVSATDTLGHTASTAVSFTIDRTAPAVTLGGFTEGATYRVDVIPTFAATDLHLLSVTATLDGAPFASGSAVSAEGPHTLLVTAFDAAGNTATATGHFSLDRTAPAITITGVFDGQLAQPPRTPVIQVDDPAAARTITLDGLPFVSGTPVTTDGIHVLTVTATDTAGNTALKSVTFTLDGTPPAIAFGGFVNGASVNANVLPTFTVTELHPGQVDATLDGAAFVSGTIVSAEGLHLLGVTATDAAGNTATATASFRIDRTAPTVVISGVTPGQLSRLPLAPVLTASETGCVITATLNGVPFVSGTPVGGDGAYTLVARATDGAGNLGPTATVSFTIDGAAPVITITGVTNGAVRNTPVTIGFGVTDFSPATVTATLDGAPFANGSVVAAEGAHTLTVNAADAAGNVANPRTVTFVLDFTPPVISVAGVTAGATAASFTVVYSATDANPPVTVTAALDGAPFSSGATISAAGGHTLVVTATDAATNTTTRTIAFTVTQSASMRPAFHFAACAFSSLSLENNAVVACPSGSGEDCEDEHHGHGHGHGHDDDDDDAQCRASVATNGAMTAKNNASVRGDAVAGGTVLLKNNANLTGRVFHGGTYTQTNGASAAGGHQSVSPPPQPCECGYDLPGRLADAQGSNQNAWLTGKPGYSAGALVHSNGTLTLPAGRYFLTSLKVKANAVLTSAAGASVELFVAGNVEVENNGRLGAAPSGVPMLVVSGAGAGGKVELKNNAEVSLLLYAPLATVELGNNSTLRGAVVGKNITLKNNQQLLFAGPQASPPPLTCP